jgi:hypothetical protein
MSSSTISKSLSTSLLSFKSTFTAGGLLPLAKLFSILPLPLPIEEFGVGEDVVEVLFLGAEDEAAAILGDNLLVASLLYSEGGREFADIL